MATWRLGVLTAAAAAVLGAAAATASADVPSPAQPILAGIGAGGGPYYAFHDLGGVESDSTLAYWSFLRGGVNVAVGKVTGGAKADIVTVPGNDGRGELRVFDGAGKSEGDPALASRGGCGIEPAVGDVNGDGHGDLVAGYDRCGGPTLQVFDGVTRRQIDSITFNGADFAGTNGFDVAAGDVDGDGRAELIAGAKAGRPPVVVAVRRGAEYRITAFAGDVTSGVHVAAADLDGDGRAEVVAAAETPDGVEVKLFDIVHGTLLGTLHPFGVVSPGTLRVAAGDVTGDGKPEIVVAADQGYTPRIVELSPQGAVLASFEGPGLGESLAVGDVRGDRKAEMVTGSGAGSWAPQVWVLDGDGSGATSFAPYDNSFYGGVRVAAADLHGDGGTEVVTGQGPGGSSEVSVFDATGWRLWSERPFGDRWTGVFVAGGDLDGDGRAEIVVASDAYEEPRVKVLDGSDRELASFLAFDSGFTGGVRVATCDLDGDGSGEIVAGAGPGGPPVVRVFTRDGRPLRSFFAFDPLFAGGVHVACGDLDGSGRAEIVVAADGGSPDVAVYDASGHRLGGFTAYETSYSGGVRVAVGDVDGDGRAEIVTAPGAGRAADVHVYREDGTVVASFLGHPEFQGGLYPAVQQPTGLPLRVAADPVVARVGAAATLTARVEDRNAADDLDGSVDWGDGVRSAVSVAPAQGGWLVRATHVYRRAGLRAVTLTVWNRYRRASAVTAQATVSRAALVAQGRTLRARGRTVSGVVATFVSGDAAATAAAFRARVAWGDGRGSAGSIVRAGGGRFAVRAAHRYRAPGRFRVVVRVRDSSGASVVATTRVVVP
jgi:hypothetical protein